MTRRRTMSLAFRIGDLLPAERCSPGALFAAEWSGSGWAAWRARRAEDPLDTSFPAVPPRHRPASGGDFEARVKEAARDGWATDDQLIEPGLVAGPCSGTGRLGPDRLCGQRGQPNQPP